jgi:hypothetical protein
MTSISPPTAPASGGSEAVPLPRRAATGAPAELRQYTNSDLLGMAELHLVLGAADQVSPNVYRMIGIYRRIVRMWLEPHLSKGDQNTPCEGCEGQSTYDECPQVGIFRQMLTEFAADLLEPQP